MKRKIIKIDEEKCNGCGLCVSACHEGAIGMVGGKAKLLKDNYCDGLGDCLPVCPVKAISFEEREAAAYDANAVKQKNAPCGCPGSAPKNINSADYSAYESVKDVPSRLAQWPAQIKLAPLNAPYFENADLLIAADCSAYACGAFHEKYMKEKVTLIGCPKLDNADYMQKLAEIIKNNDIKSVTVVRMEVPCCSGLAAAVLKAAEMSGKNIAVKTIVLKLNGKEI